MSLEGKTVLLRYSPTLILKSVSHDRQTTQRVGKISILQTHSPLNSPAQPQIMRTAIPYGFTD